MKAFLCLLSIFGAMVCSSHFVSNRNRVFTDYQECFDKAKQKPPKERLHFDGVTWSYDSLVQNRAALGVGPYTEREYVGDLPCSNMAAHIYLSDERPNERFLVLLPPAERPNTQTTYESIWCHQKKHNGKWVTNGNRTEVCRNGMTIETGFKLGLQHGVERHWIPARHHYEEYFYENGRYTGKSRRIHEDGTVLFDSTKNKIKVENKN